MILDIAATKKTEDRVKLVILYTVIILISNTVIITIVDDHSTDIAQIIDYLALLSVQHYSGTVIPTLGGAVKVPTAGCGG